MDAPTVEEIRSWSQVRFDELGYGEDTPDPLQLLVDRATVYVADVTGRPMADLPTEYEVAFKEAIQRWVEHTAFRTQEDIIETAADFDLIQNFSVTGYSETRRGAEDAKKAQQIHPWPLLHDILWRLATDEKRDEWREAWGILVPAFEVTEIDWSGTDRPFYYGLE